LFSCSRPYLALISYYEQLLTKIPLPTNTFLQSANWLRHLLWNLTTLMSSATGLVFLVSASAVVILCTRQRIERCVGLWFELRKKREDYNHLPCDDEVHLYYDSAKHSSSSADVDHEDRGCNFDSFAKRDVYVLRHGERMDCMLKDWRYLILSSFPSNILVPLRKNAFINYRLDTPLTGLGIQQVYDMGLQMANAGVKPVAVYCSPALRCIQTAHALVSGLNLPLKLNIELGLLEAGNTFRDFITHEELEAAGFCINKDYVPILRCLDPEKRENAEETCLRGKHVMDCILKKTGCGKSVLIVGHASSFAMLTAQLRGFLKDLQHVAVYAELHKAVETPQGHLKKAKTHFVPNKILSVGYQRARKIFNSKKRQLLLENLFMSLEEKSEEQKHQIR
ncbi:hypothetical protein SK128_013624, partial [Halocaridina rubra]